MRFLYLVPLVVLLAGCGVELVVPNPDPNHVHADFEVVLDGKPWDFSAPRYMSDHPDGAGEPTPGGTYLNEYVHLHDGDGGVMHMHKAGLTVGDFLTSLKWQYVNGCLVTDTAERYCTGAGKDLRMVVNGVEAPFDLAYAPHDLDKWLISFGAAGRDVLAEFAGVSDRACIPSLVCPWRGEPPHESCVSDPNIPCMVH